VIFQSVQLTVNSDYASSVLGGVKCFGVDLAFGLLSPVACDLFPDSSGWIFHPLDDPYRLFLNNDAGSSGIAANLTRFFPAHFVPKNRIFRPICLQIFSVFVKCCFLCVLCVLRGESFSPGFFQHPTT